MSISIPSSAKPFLKWAGGKTQLIGEIEKRLPANFANGGYTYIEPFVGSGAVLFWMLSTYPNIKRAVINDVNEDLIGTYKAIAANAQELIGTLGAIQEDYYSFGDNQQKKAEYYYKIRDDFNSRSKDKVTHAALFIFLNRTCFNGLYRVNRNNEFNVPMGAYKKPTICDSANIIAVSNILKKVDILCGDFEQTEQYASGESLFYFDPPYKPLNSTSSFNAYAKTDFNDHQQVRLKHFCSALDAKGYQWMLSNSDVRTNPNSSSFFDELYAQFNISRVKATRRINSNAQKRGELNELLITNY